MSTLLVAVMTIWATSSPFSPLAPQSNVETVDEPVSMLQKVKDAFASSESVLPSPIIEPVANQLQPTSPTAAPETEPSVSYKTNAEELARMEETHAIQQDDRQAWLSFPRQDSLLVTKPIDRGVEIRSQEALATETSNLPEVHFASAEPRPLPMQNVYQESVTVPRLPTKLSIAADRSSEQEQETQPASIVTVEQPTRIATLPARPRYIAPYGNKNTTSAIEISPALPRQKSWETGLY